MLSCSNRVESLLKMSLMRDEDIPLYANVNELVPFDLIFLFLFCFAFIFSRLFDIVFHMLGSSLLRLDAN